MLGINYRMSKTTKPTILFMMKILKYLEKNHDFFKAMSANLEWEPCHNLRVA